MDARTTTTLLLESLHDPKNEAVWSEFDLRYRPILGGLARRMGLSPVDAEEVAQETLARFVKRYWEGGYDRERGRLRSWILSIARNCATDLYRARGKLGEVQGATAISELPGEAELERIWEEEQEKAILGGALRALRGQTGFDERTVRAFELIAFEHERPADVAKRLELGIDSVYTAKNRCIKRLRVLVGEIEALYAE